MLLYFLQGRYKKEIIIGASAALAAIVTIIIIVSSVNANEDKRMFKKYEKIEDALKDANEKGYGIVMPSPEEMSLEEPRVVRTANGYGAKISAHAEAIHMIKTGIHSEVCPMVGTEEQTEEVVKFLYKEFEDEPKGVWQSKIFGKSLYDLVKDGMNSKLEHMPDESRLKLGETIEKIINDGANGLICILL